MSAIAQAFKDPDLRKKILITLALMFLYRVGSQIPSPGVDYALINQRLEEVAQGDSATMFSIIGLFSGGALLQLSIFAIGIMPYITASIILQLLVVVIPRLEALKKELGFDPQALKPEPKPRIRHRFRKNPFTMSKRAVTAQHLAR